MKKRVISAIIMILIFVPFLIIGGVPFTILMSLLGIFGLYELLHIREEAKKKFPLPMKIIAYIMVLVIVLSNYKAIDFQYKLDYRLVSSIIFLFLSHYATCFIFVYPLIIAYGQIHPMHIKFYYIGLFYPVLSFLFEVGIVLLFVYPFYFFKEWLKKHLVVKFIINTLTLVIGCILYSQVL